MNIQLSRLVTGVLVVAAVVLTADRSWAVYYQLDPSKDDWGLKYDVELNAADRDTVNVVFTLTDEGRLKPIYSITVVSFSPPDSQGGRSYDVKAPIELKKATAGKRSGQVQIPKKFVDRAMIRILTLTVDGRRQTAGAAYYDIPLKKFLNKAPVAGSPQPPPSN
ncbi:MAG: hypothetical protein FJ143_19295 [Deltaproteobacteria bacterium]|nr:hypothetical protein [Deltaproteobacteria bacterium]